MNTAYFFYNYKVKSICANWGDNKFNTFLKYYNVYRILLLLCLIVEFHLSRDFNLYNYMY